MQRVRCLSLQVRRPGETRREAIAHSIRPLCHEREPRRPATSVRSKAANGAIGTLVERQTRLLRLVHLPRSDSDSLHAALVARMKDLPPALMRSITWDQGTEMARHLATTAKLGAPVYFCDSRSPWQRGSNENTNGLLRDYFPKGVTLIDHSPEHLLAVENEHNRRPRMVLQDRCPADLFAALLASSGPSVLRRWLEPTPSLLA
jgi:IS30 family transposase